ncbi:MAG: hypothetical protein HYV08_03135 [Deltaproteobacteria bacterium]|nr:hypothetical protein [Deltaproteobacteria bacterium]
MTCFGVVASFNSTLTSQLLGDGSFSATATLLTTSPEQWSVVSTGTVSGVIRTISLRLRRGPYHPDAAVVTGGNLNISGNPTINGTLGSVHSNADLSVSGNATIAVNATASGTYSSSGNPSIGGTAAGSQPTMYIPPIIPSSYQQYATYELRSDGLVYCGQAGAAEGCTPGALIVGGLTEWSYNAGQGLWSQSGNTATNGALYVQGNVSVSGSPGSSSTPWQLTIIATGSVTMSGNPSIQSYTQNLLFIAGTDIAISGSFTQYGSEAVIAAHEEVRISGTPTIKGTILAEGSTDVDAILGNPTITYGGTLGPTPIPGPLVVVARSEAS